MKAFIVYWKQITGPIVPAFKASFRRLKTRVRQWKPKRREFSVRFKRRLKFGLKVASAVCTLVGLCLFTWSLYKPRKMLVWPNGEWTEPLNCTQVISVDRAEGRYVKYTAEDEEKRSEELYFPPGPVKGPHWAKQMQFAAREKAYELTYRRWPW